tara:strand:- start:117 stop:557 length:441 start_codon:yes stop_codon:yes gene_type:complete
MEKWINYLTEFTKGICDSNINQNDKGHYLFTTSEILDLKTSLSTKYGFLEILFPNNQTQTDFLSLSNINKNITQKDTVKLIQTKWDNSKFPCRVFVEKKKIQFYDKTNDLNNKEKFENRIIVLESIFKTLIDLKIQYALKINELEN